MLRLNKSIIMLPSITPNMLRCAPIQFGETDFRSCTCLYSRYG